MNKYKLLLLEDVVNHGRKGEVVDARAGYARNFLLPKGRAIMATQGTLKMRERLSHEREEQAKRDLETALLLKNTLHEISIEVEVKVDADGNMYGSVTVSDIANLMQNRGYGVEKQMVMLQMPIRQLGRHPIRLKLPEGVETTVYLVVNPDRIITKKVRAEESKTPEAPQGETP